MQIERTWSSKAHGNPGLIQIDNFDYLLLSIQSAETGIILGERLKQLREEYSIFDRRKDQCHPLEKGDPHLTWSRINLNLSSSIRASFSSSSSSREQREIGKRGC